VRKKCYVLFEWPLTVLISHSAPFWVTSHGDCDNYIDTHNDGASMNNLCIFSQLLSQ
jgi:hypothetical protein